VYDKTNWNQTFSSIKNVNIAWLSFAIVWLISSHVIRAIRWNMLTKPSGYDLNIRRSFYAVMIGYIVNTATSRGGEIEKAPVDFLIGTVITERIVDMLIMVSLCFLCLAAQYQYIWNFVDTYIIGKITPLMPMWLASLLFIAAIAGLTWFLKSRKIRPQDEDGIIQRLIKGVRSIFTLKNPWLFIFYSVLIWVGYWMGVYGTLQALEVTEHLHFWASLSTLLFSAVGIAIPLPAGAGVWAAISFGLTTVYKVPTEHAETFGIFNLAVSNILVISLGGLSALLWWIELQKIEKENG
jgi:uncharacterized protein (TIRG00374 family)